MFFEATGEKQDQYDHERKETRKAQAGRAPVCWDASEQESNFLKREVVFREVFFFPSSSD